MFGAILQAITLPGGYQIGGVTGFGLADQSIGGIISIVFSRVVIPAAAFVALIFLIIGGYQFITSTGDPKAVDSARWRIWMALIGFVLIVASWWLLKLISDIFDLGVT